MCSKFATFLFVKHLSRQVDCEPFTVNALSPGYQATQMDKREN